jgi:hypothetical protein
MYRTLSTGIYFIKNTLDRYNSVQEHLDRQIFSHFPSGRG